MKTQYRARWIDLDTDYAPEPRDRVAYLLRAARSRGARIDRRIYFDGMNGRYVAYYIGDLALTPDPAGLSLI